MGIIIKQSAKGTLWSYLGVILGFITTSYLYTEYLTPEIVGLFALLISFTKITGRLATMGSVGVTARLFPYFRDKSNGNNGFLFSALLFNFVGFSIFLIAYYLAKPYLVASNLEKSTLFAEYVYLLIPLTLATALFLFLDTYNKVLYDAVLGTFLQEFVQRFLIGTFTVLYIFNVLNVHQLIISFAIALAAKSVVIIVHLFLKRQLDLRPHPGFMKPEFRKELMSVAAYSMIGGFGTMIVFNIDKIVINHMVDLANTGVYFIAFFFGSLVALPSRPLLKIAGTLIADAWKRNDTKTINDIYYKSCLNQLIIGGFLFLGIWVNIDNILTILGDDYLQSRWVIFFVGLGYLIDMSTGANGLILSYSKYYRVTTFFVLTLIVISLILMYLFIPIMGITGAALAICLSLFLNNLMRYVFLYKKYGFQPFKLKFIYVLVLYFIIWLVISIIPQQTLIVDLFIRSALVVLFTTVILLVFNFSEDITDIFNNLKSRFIK